MPIEFRYAALNEYGAISSFLDQHWAKDHIYTRVRPLFDWSFHRPRHWDSDSYSFTLALDGDQLIGILGGIPFTFNRFGETSKAVWIVNYVIREDYRKGATALKLMGSFRNPDFSAVVAFGITPETAIIYKVLRGKVVPEIPRHILVMPGQTERVAKTLQIAYPDWPAEKTVSLASAYELQKLPATPPAFGRTLPENWDEADWPEHAQQTVGAARDRDYLMWRYSTHPLFVYRFIAVQEGKRTGLAVWRLETIREQTPDGRKDLDLIGRLVEFMPVSASNAENLFGAFVKELSQMGAMAADYYGYHGPTRQWLTGLGFRSCEAHPDGSSFPTRFQPLDGVGGSILGAVFLPQGTPDCTADSDCSWYWTKADSDQDRPN